MKDYFIYKITNPIGEVYIGQTCNPATRLDNYKWKSSNKQKKIFESIIEYGYKNHIFEIFLDRYNKKSVDAEEIRLIALYKNANLSLNISDGGHLVSFTRRKAVVKFSLNGDFIEEFLSIKDAADSIGINPCSINSALKKKLFYCKGFLWCYKLDYEKGFIPTWVASNKGKSTLAKELYQFDLGGNFIAKFNSAEEAGRVIGEIPTSISANLRGEIKRVKDWIFSYYTTVEPYVKKTKKIRMFTRKRKYPLEIFTRDNKLIGSFDSMSDAANYIGISVAAIKYCLDRDGKNKNYYFKLKT